MNAAGWIDQARILNGWRSDYRAAKELKTTSACISVYRNKPNATMSDDVAVRVARAVGQSAALVILDQVAERTKSKAAKAALKAHLRQVAPH
jgi:hypothetical protein